MFQLPELPYNYDDLEPPIDKKTMKIHYSKHHQGYVNKLNKALEGYDKLSSKSVQELLSNLDDVPQEVRTKVRNFGGGHLNHSLFWPSMSPNGGGEPSGQLADVIRRVFGGFDEFKQEFEDTASGVFGSGWGWLVANPSGDLELVQTKNQDNPISNDLEPLLGVDVWEHAYYLKYQNKRGEYLENWWSVVDWDKIEERYQKIV
ncbi:MAG: superoxide dismutase [Candidatus Magasanikbacteria bacterium]